MDLENVTHRKRYRTSSLNDITNVNEESCIFDSTMMSLPDCTNNNSQTLYEMNEKIKLLTKDLQIAHQEIENLNTENFRLKADLHKSLNIIESYKKINETIDRKSMTPLSGRKRKFIQNKIIRTPIDSRHLKTIDHISSTSPTSEYLSPINVIESECEGTQFILKPQCVQTNECQNLTPQLQSLQTLSGDTPTITSNIKEISVDLFSRFLKDAENKDVINSNTLQKNTLHNDAINTCISVEEEKRQKIVVIADQQGRNVGRILQTLVGPKYDVLCLCKPGAQLKDVLEWQNDIVLSLGKHDYVIILSGSNDRNPHEFLFNLRNWLKQVPHTNIIMPEVPFNYYLREQKLNYELRFICKRFKNVSYVNMDYTRFRPNRYFFSLNLCRSLLREILHNEYKIKALTHQQKINKVNTWHVEKSTQTDLNMAYQPEPNILITSEEDFFRS